MNIGKRKKLITLENFVRGKAQAINSSLLRACSAGLDPVELQPRSLKWFQDENELKEVALCKYEHFNTRREEKLNIVRAERKIIVKFLNEGGPNASGACHHPFKSQLVQRRYIFQCR